MDGTRPPGDVEETKPGDIKTTVLLKTEIDNNVYLYEVVTPSEYYKRLGITAEAYRKRKQYAKKMKRKFVEPIKHQIGSQLMYLIRVIDTEEEGFGILS